MYVSVEVPQISAGIAADAAVSDMRTECAVHTVAADTAAAAVDTVCVCD